MEIFARSSIKPSLIRSTLFTASLWGGLGATLFVVAAFLSPPYLTYLGFPLFLVGLLLIAWGFFPYRRLKKLELQPFVLGQEEGLWILSRNQRPIFKFATTSIAKIDYLENEKSYGLGIVLKEDQKQMIVVEENLTLFPFPALPGYDLFFPYFPASAQATLQSSH